MLPIAQLIKLQDYISRYEWDIYRYPTQYIRLKKENWNKLYSIWENPEILESPIETEQELATEKTSKSTFSNLKAKLKRNKEIESEQKQSNPQKKSYANLPETEEELKHYFLDKLFQFQMKWATSTVTETSFVTNEYYHDPLLKYLLQRFPDSYFLMYFPVFRIKKAPIESEIILISPVEIEIIYFIEKSSDTVIMASDERTWTIEKSGERSKILSPLIALKRTEKLLRSILAAHAIDFSIKKTVLSQTNSIVYATEAYDTKIIGQKDYQDWFQEKRKLSSPLKNMQLKATEALLKHCQVTSIKRPGWETDTTTNSFVDTEE